MTFTFRAWSEDEPGEEWLAKFHELWPLYRRWYLSEGDHARPRYLRCERALREWMPELMPVWERWAELAGGGDLEARFLSLWCPPPYLSGCSQAAYTSGQPLLVRNYDYHPRLCEGLLARTAWTGSPVLASTDCLVGVLDGINADGLAVSLSFGGKRDVGEGFGAPIVLRYLLEVCRTTREAGAALERIPFHMAYNVLVLDRTGDFLTAFVGPRDRPVLRPVATSTNHQDRIVWPRHARVTATLAREVRLQRLVEEDPGPETFVQAFLESPLHNTRYSNGFGTLYTAAWRPAAGSVTLRWPGISWTLSLGEFEPGTRTVTWKEAATPPVSPAVGGPSGEPRIEGADPDP